MRDEEDIVMTVSDTGIGIPADVRNQVFRAFEKGSGAQTTSVIEADEAGVGLGLTIVKSFVELHGGDVEIKSQPGRGTAVSIRVPVEHKSVIAATEDPILSNNLNDKLAGEAPSKDIVT